jgi:excisionase family DNA binding protein
LTDVRDRLSEVFAPEIVDALEAFVLELVTEQGNGTSEAESPWMGIDEAADYLRVSSRTVERRVKAGRVRSTTIGRRRLLHRDDLDRLAKMATGEETAPTAPPRRRE